MSPYRDFHFPFCPLSSSPAVGYCGRRIKSPLCWEPRTIKAFLFFNQEWVRSRAFFCLALVLLGILSNFCLQSPFIFYVFHISFHNKVMRVIQSELDFDLWFNELCVAQLWPSRLTGFQTSRNHSLWSRLLSLFRYLFVNRRVFVQ